MTPKSVDGWIEVFRTGTDFEAAIVKDRLADLGLDPVILTHRDRAFNLNVGDLSTIRILVPPSQARDALDILRSAPLSDSDLDSAALESDPFLGEDEPE